MPMLSLAIVAGWIFMTVESSAIEYDIADDTVNKLQNSSFDIWQDETPKNWVIENGSENSIAVDQASGLIDDSSLKLQVNDYKKGVVSVVSEAIEVESSKYYDLKLFYITDTKTSLLVREFSADGSISTSVLGNYPDFDYPLSAMASRFKTRDNTVKAQVVVNISGKGYIELDESYFKISDNQIPMPTPDGQNLFKADEWTSKSADQFNTTSLIENNKFVTKKTDQSFGLAGWTPPKVGIKAHQYYYYSFKYQSDNDISIVVDYELSDGSYRYEVLDTAPANSEYSEYSLFIDVPSDAISMQPSLQISNGTISQELPKLVLVKDSASFTEPIVSITFDDGLYTSYSNGGKTLNENNMKATYYINPGLIGQNRYMGDTDVRDLLANGHQIGSHTYIHTDITMLSKKALNNDLKKANKYISKLGIQNIDFASPYGKYDQILIPSLKENQSSHRGTEMGINTKQNLNKDELYGLFIRKTTTDDDLRKQLNDAKLKKGWIILIYHDIELSSSEFSIDKETFDRHVKIIKDSGIKVSTVESALGTVGGQ